MKSILVHMCCGPCSIYPIKSVLAQDVQLCGFFFNPNIAPRAEFEKRLESVKTLSRLMEIKVIYKDFYQVEDFLRDRSGTRLRELAKEDRCRHCYDIRLEAVAQVAAQEGFDSFSSSLLYSRYQNHELIKDLGLKYARKYGVELFYHDFREGWREGIDISKEMGLYRQKYCGCIFSWMERYRLGPFDKKVV